MMNMGDMLEPKRGGSCSRPAFAILLVSVIAMAMVGAFVLNDWNGPVEASGETSGTCGDGLYWSIDGDGKLTITGSGPMTNYKASDERWGGNTVKTVVIGDGVTSIGDRAFYECRSLNSVTIPDSVTSIGQTAFYRCSDLTSADIPSSATIGRGAFNGCTSLTSIHIPDSVKVGENAFYGCSKITEISFGGSVTIDPKAFRPSGSGNTEFCDENGTTLDTSTDIDRFYGKTFVGNMSKMTMVRAEGYTITFDPDNDGNSWNETYLYGASIEKPKDPEKTGHTFQYWMDANGKEFDFENETMPAADLTLKALWEPKTFTVTYDTGTGSSSTQTCKYNETITLPDSTSAIASSKPGYKLTGWETGSEAYSPGAEYTVTAEVTFTAKWTETFEVTYDAGTMTVIITSCEYNCKISLLDEESEIASSKPGYKLTAWNTEGGTYLPGAEYTVVSNVTFTAVWTAEEYPIDIKDTASLTVTNGEGEEIENGEKVAYGTELTVEAAVKEGYTSKVFHNGDELTDGKFTVYLTNVLTVEYTAIEYTVTIAVQGEGSVDEGELKIPYGTAASVKGNVLTFGGNTVTATPSDDNHRFTDWSGVPTTVTSDVTITASFSQIFIDDKAEIKTDTADIVAEKTGAQTSIVSEIKADVADVDGAMTDTLEKIAEIERASGSSYEDITVQVIVPVDDGSKKLTMSVATATALKGSGAELTVTNGDTTVSLDADAIGTLEGAAVASGYPLSIEVTPDPTDLSDSQKKVIGDNQAVDVSAFIGSEKTSNLGGKATISIPYVTDKKVKVTYVMDNGRTEDVDCTYADGVVSFVTTHFSVYMVSEIAETVPVVPDTDDDWNPVVPTAPAGTSYSNDDTKTLVACAAAAVAAALVAMFLLVDSRKS